MQPLQIACLLNVLLFSIVSAPAYGQPASPHDVTASADELSEAKPIGEAALLRLMKLPNSFVLFDVRSRDEYQVSHLASARHVDPLTAPEALIRRLERRKLPPTVVFYCTLGERSTVLAESVAPALKERGAKHVLVLKNGIIGWANAGQPLFNRSGPTRFVHPLNQALAKHLKAPEWATFEPQDR
jgi:rhodanese-related sulfurtransferase